MTRLRYWWLWLYWFVADMKCVRALHRDCGFSWLSSLDTHLWASERAAYRDVFESKGTP